MTSSPLAPLLTDGGRLDARRGSLLHGSYELVAGDVVVGRLENSAWGHSTMTTATGAWQLGHARGKDPVWTLEHQGVPVIEARRTNALTGAGEVTITEAGMALEERVLLALLTLQAMAGDFQEATTAHPPGSGAP